jgi:subtilisin family serine protease
MIKYGRKFLKLLIFLVLGITLVFPVYKSEAKKCGCACLRNEAQVFSLDLDDHKFQPNPTSPFGINNFSFQRVVVVAVTDTGVDIYSEKLKPFLWENNNERVLNHIDDDHNGFVDDYRGLNFINSSATPLDDNGHGTHVAGIISGLSDSQPPGSAPIPLRILSVKFLNFFGNGSLDGALKSICYTIAFRKQYKLPVVINASWVWTGEKPPHVLRDVIEEAGEAGILFVAAAGNDSECQPAYPAAYDLDNVISVGATDDKGHLTEYSNLKTDIAARGDNVSSLRSNGGTIVMSGTSMAAPLVTQAAVRLLALRDYTPKELKKIILRDLSDESKDLEKLVKEGRLLNMQKTLAYKP